MKFLLTLNDAPYGSEKAYNALRLVMKLRQERDDAEMRIVLMGDGASSALPHQSTPRGYYNIERMLRAVIGKRRQVKTCGICMEARGIERMTLIECIEVSTMSQLAHG